jgi:KaiC/GvpD/RAD55 family RecA-like ATPase
VVTASTALFLSGLDPDAMSETEGVAPTGIDVLDGMLNGGLPRRRATLVAGGPGTGKSTLGMQFLQTGLAAGEGCLFASTEQTIDGIRGSFAGFEFDLDHPDLSITSIHATPGRTIEDEETLTLETMEGEGTEDGFGEYGVPFTLERIQDHLREFGPVDRVVFDSVSGLHALGRDPERYRRLVLDLVRFVVDDLGATAVFTAEEHEDGDGEQVDSALRFTAHGVLRLDREPIAGDRHRFLEVVKMRGVDHDRRRVEVEFVDGGLRAGPARRSQPPALKDHAHQPIGIDGLDRLTGGGLAVGASVLLTHDGRTTMNALLARLLAFGFETDRTVVLFPTIELRESRLARLLSGFDRDLDALLADGRLAVVDVIGGWDDDRANVCAAPDDVESFTALLGGLTADADGPLLGVANGDAIAHRYGSDGARRAVYFTESAVIGSDDVFVHLVNPGVVGDATAAFFEDAAEQVLRLRTRDDGLGYVTLRKSPCGFVGSTSLVEYVEEPPYLRVQQPPRTREDSHACE